jgi:hypothetical protein
MTDFNNSTWTDEFEKTQRKLALKLSQEDVEDKFLLRKVLFESQQFLDLSWKLFDSLDEKSCENQYSSAEVKEMFAFVLKQHAIQLGNALGEVETERKSRIDLMSIGPDVLDCVLSFLEPQDLMRIRKLAPKIESLCQSRLMKSIKLEADYDCTILTMSGLDGEEDQYRVGFFEDIDYSDTENVEVVICCSDHCVGRIPQQLFKIPQIKTLKFDFEANPCGTYDSMFDIMKEVVSRHIETLKSCEFSLPFNQLDEFTDRFYIFNGKVDAKILLKESSVGGPATETFLSTDLLQTHVTGLTVASESQSVEMDVFTGNDFKETVSVSLKKFELKRTTWGQFSGYLSCCKELELVEFSLPLPVSLQQFMNASLFARLQKLTLDIEESWCADPELFEVNVKNLKVLKLSGSLLNLSLVKTFCDSAEDLSELDILTHDLQELTEDEILQWIFSNLEKHKNLYTLKVQVKVGFAPWSKKEEYLAYQDWGNLFTISKRFPSLKDFVVSISFPSKTWVTYFSSFLLLVSEAKQMNQRCQDQDVAFRELETQIEKPPHKKRKLNEM